MGRRKDKNNLKQIIVGIIAFIIIVSGYIGIYKEFIYEEDKEVISKNATSFDLSSIPDYTDKAYVTLNNNIPNFTEEDYTKEAFETYSELDFFGRCGVAFANVCREIMPKKGEERGEIGSIKPSGWQTVRYNGIVNGNYLYNRCHLIGWQLAGENDNKRNLITGTRYMNVEGMLPFENLVDDYLEKEANKDNHVLYRVTPIFEGENLVASGVQMEAYSIEDKGEGICFNVYVYNVQPRYRN